jgi:ATP-dependent Clp protease adapter protein ClpS
MWRVEIRDDSVNSFPVVVHLVQTLCAMTTEDALRLAQQVHQRGSAPVGEFHDQFGAERLVVTLQRHGLHATVRRA